MKNNEQTSNPVFSLLVLIKCSDCSNIDHRRSRTPHHWLKKQDPRSTAEDTESYFLNMVSIFVAMTEMGWADENLWIFALEDRHPGRRNKLGRKLGFNDYEQVRKQDSGSFSGISVHHGSSHILLL